MNIPTMYAGRTRLSERCRYQTLLSHDREVVQGSPCGPYDGEGGWNQTPVVKGQHELTREEDD